MSSIPEFPILVYDVGGSHVSAAVCLGRDLQLGPVVRGSYPEEKSSQAFTSFIHALGAEAGRGFAPVKGATLAFPGPFDYPAGISLMHHKLPYLYGVNLRQALASIFGWQPSQVSFLNDAGAYLLGEVGAGAAHGCARAISITLGTGTGSAFAVNGQLVTEGAGVPPGGEVWNLPWEGGIVEDYLSTRGVIAGYQRRTGKLCDVKALADDAARDQAAAETFHDFGRHLGRVIGSRLAGFAPEVVVLGGGISRAAQLFLPTAQSELASSGLLLCVSALQDSAPLVGCAVAWFNH
jgi:glucokinase